MSDAVATPETTDIRPIVRTAGNGKLTLWLFIAALAIGGLLFFNTLNARRQNLAAQTAVPMSQEGGTISAPPPLNIPQIDETPLPQYPTDVAPVTPSAFANPAAPVPQIITHVVERTVSPSAPFVPTTLPPPQAPVRTPAVIERPASAEGAKANGADPKDRVTAGRLINPSLTVPQGTIIAAVLETAMDSTRPGAVRAIVSRDVRGFDGSKILVPRGSRLYGEYESDLQSGQKRALVIWHRLTRPDAVIIDLGSPAADPLGRAGIGGKVDTHFFERFGGAILQSALDIGVAVASRSIMDYPVIVALPGSTQQVTKQQPQQVQPTLKVQQGTSVSVFVSRDLDFSTVDR